MKIIFGIIIAILVIGIWFPIIPFAVKNGWHGAGSEWCGIVYDPTCDEIGVRFLTLKETRDVIKYKAY